ncbi:MAG: hypothetical protein HY909_22030 [Deltaproteobacteria bacterium]|nr:hypothetical protein [Deltaproteobacteria bacterium]
MKASWKILGIVLGTSLACGGQGSSFPPATDSGTTPTDTGTAMGDTGTAPTDSGARPDSGVPADTGTRPDTSRPPPSGLGECGMSVRTALCACGAMDARCQTAAVNADMGCAQCLAANQQSCCPTEAGAIQSCAMSSGCMDVGCVMSMCGRQIAALQTCYMGRLQMEAMSGGGACVTGYIGCLGDIVTMGQAAVCR